MADAVRQGSISFTVHFVEAETSKESIKTGLDKTGLELAEAKEAETAKARADFAAQKAKEQKKAEKAELKAQPSSGGSSLFGGKQFATPNPSGTLKVRL